ncbi:MAG: hypothetical protein V4556_07945 [Bacteroidota bacterium]
MKKVLLIVTAFFISIIAFSQNMNGQWRGYFDDNGNISLYNEKSTEYVLELKISGTKITGHSYTYFEGRKYFVICTLEGTYDKKTKNIKVTETARIKGNTPPMEDCFQTHILTYKKVAGKEELVGRWVPAPGYNCGVGATTLSRKVITPVASTAKKTKSNTLFSAPKTPVKPKPIITKPADPTIAKTTPKVKPVNPVTAQPEKTNPEIKEVPKTNPVKVKDPEIDFSKDFEKRDNNVLKTIEIDNPTFKVELYDNGDIDGDSVSLFYNSKLLFSHKKLSTKPITLNLSIDDDNDDKINELIMYAENLGEIPPNTALMIVTDGNNRYEVRITSDLQKSGVIRFVRKK